MQSLNFDLNLIILCSGGRNASYEWTSVVDTYNATSQTWLPTSMLPVTAAWGATFVFQDGILVILFFNYYLFIYLL